MNFLRAAVAVLFLVAGATPAPVRACCAPGTAAPAVSAQMPCCGGAASACCPGSVHSTAPAAAIACSDLERIASAVECGRDPSAPRVGLARFPVAFLPTGTSLFRLHAQLLI